MTTPLRKNQPPQPDVEPPPSRPFRLHALWRAALILFPLNLILVYLAELSGGVSPTTALAQSLGNPLVGVPAFAFVTTAALQRYLSRRHLRQLTRANQVKLDALTHV